MEDEGAFLPSSYDKGSIINQDIWYDWNGDRKLFSEDYIKYFERNQKALIKNIVALQCKEEIK